MLAVSLSELSKICTANLTSAYFTRVGQFKNKHLIVLFVSELIPITLLLDVTKTGGGHLPIL